MMSNYCKNYEECRNVITNKGHNGLPLFDGRVCDDCNTLVINRRLYLLERSLR